MLLNYLKQISFIEIYILITLFWILKNKKVSYFNQLLFFLIISIINENILNFQNVLKIKINGLNTNIYVIIVFAIWLIILLKKKKNIQFIILSFFILFSIVNLFLIENWKIFNFNTFIVGTLIYVICFLIISYKNLNKENFAFFQSNYFILILAPVLFFLGLSLMFSFRNKPLLETRVFEIQLYIFVNYTVNIIYYTLINLYIFKERKQKNA